MAPKKGSRSQKPAAETQQLAAVEVHADPENRGTVVLDRWPDESEKDEQYQERVAKARKGE